MGIVATLITIGFSAWLTSIHSGQVRAEENVAGLMVSVATLNEAKENSKEQFQAVNNHLDNIDKKLDLLLTKIK